MKQDFAELTLDGTVKDRSLRSLLSENIAPVFHTRGKTGRILFTYNAELGAAGKRKDRAEADEEEKVEQRLRRRLVSQFEGVGKRKACEEADQEERIRKRRRTT